MADSEIKSILIVDDDPNICAIIRKAAEPMGFDVTSTCESRHAVALVKRHKPDILFTDIDMPDTDGLTLLHGIADMPSAPTIVVMSGLGSVYLSVANQLTKRYGMKQVASLQKPFRLTELRSLLADCSDDSAPLSVQGENASR